MDTGNEKLRVILGPPGPELGCDECFERLDEYVEMELRGQDAEARVRGMRAHLEGCAACRDEHEALRAFLDGAEPRGGGPGGLRR